MMNNKITSYSLTTEKLTQFIVICNNQISIKERTFTGKILKESFSDLINIKTDVLNKIAEELKYEVITDFDYDCTKEQHTCYLKEGCKVLNLSNGALILEKIKSITPTEGNFDNIKNYLTGLFNGEEGYNAINNFIAYKRSNPFELIKLAFYIVGSNRTGKSFFVNHFLSSILGYSNTTTMSNRKISDFNGNLASKLLISIEEARFKDQSDVEVFKDMISNDYIFINPKGKTEYRTRAFHSLFFTSNETPTILQKEGKSNRFILMNLTKTLIRNEEHGKQILSEIPAYLFYLKFLKSQKPSYKDFDCVNQIKDYSDSNNEQFILEEAINQFIFDLEGKLTEGLFENNGKKYLKLDRSNINKIFENYKNITLDSTISIDKTACKSGVTLINALTTSTVFKGHNQKKIGKLNVKNLIEVIEVEEVKQEEVKQEVKQEEIKKQSILSIESDIKDLLKTNKIKEEARKTSTNFESNMKFWISKKDYDSLLKLKEQLVNIYNK